MNDLAKVPWLMRSLPQSRGYAGRFHVLVVAFVWECGGGGWLGPLAPNSIPFEIHIYWLALKSRISMALTKLPRDQGE